MVSLRRALFLKVKKTQEEAGGKRCSTFRVPQPSSTAIAVEPPTPASCGSADQRGFTDRSIRVVHLALGSSLGNHVLCNPIGRARTRTRCDGTKYKVARHAIRPGALISSTLTVSGAARTGRAAPACPPAAGTHLPPSGSSKRRTIRRRTRSPALQLRNRAKRRQQYATDPDGVIAHPSEPQFPSSQAVICTWL
jgi:hypothetical protein